jgi:glycosyltransferase involved in cell wall biosynthesis
MNILVHTSFIGTTGYNNHARSFFTALNKYHNVKVRNYTVGSTWKFYSPTCHDSEPYLTDEMRSMLILQTLHNNDGTLSDYPLYNYKGDFNPDVNIILNDLNHHYFYENYEGYTIGYNVWESTEYPENFLEVIKKFNEFWVPSEWQKENLIKQGYPRDKIFVVPEGVDEKTFYPNHKKSFDKFTFGLFGRWEYRKSTKEIIETFINTFENNNDVQLILSTNNYFANDGFKSTEERLKHYNLENEKIKVIDFPTREEYVNYLQNEDVFISCARSEGWNLPLIESMACGKPSIYSNWGAQLEFAKDLGVPVNVLHEVPAKTQDPSFVGNYIEPDFNDLSKKMMDVYRNYDQYKTKGMSDSKKIIENFNWDSVAKLASNRLEKINRDFVFVTTGNIGYMPVIEKLVQSLGEFSKHKIIVYGVECEVPFDYNNVIKKSINPPKHSLHDKWYWKQYACIESLKENFENFIWIDGDVVVNHNIDDIKKYFSLIDNYPISDIHRQEDFFGFYNYEGNTFSQMFNQNICNDFDVTKRNPIMHVCLYIYNKNCEWWFNEIIDFYKNIPLESYGKYLLWNDEGIDNYLRWKYNFSKHLPLSNFDTSSYDGDDGQTQNQITDFYSFWEIVGPYNFNRIYGYQYIPKNKNEILYFHGNKNSHISDKMIEFLKLKRDVNFYESEYFWVSKNELLNLGEIKNVEGSTISVAEKYGWDYAIYHEIYNLQDYYLNRIKKINKGDVVVDLGGNIGIFNRWAYSEGADLVISFEPDKRYFNLLSKNSDPRSILFNAAMSNKIGTVNLYESSHLGGSNIMDTNPSFAINYKVRTYTLDYLFETKLINRIDFLKIDIEGAEIMVLNGISDENLMKVKNISMEYHHGHLNYDENVRFNLINRLNKLGFNSHILFCGYDNNLQLIYFWR